MKIFLTIALLVSSSAFAFTAEQYSGEFAGGGNWNTLSGEKGTWRATSKITQTKNDGVEIAETLTLVMADGTKHVETAKYNLVKTAPGFFGVTIKGVRSGWGYCQDRTCHMTINHDGNKSEETMYFAKNGRVFRVGSEVTKDHTVTWNGQMAKKGSCKN